jgi:tyrosinase
MRAQNYTEYKVELHTEHNDATNTTTQYNETVPYTRTRKVRDPNAPSRHDVVAKNLDGNRQNIQSRVYNLLAFEHDYLKMSSEVQGPNNIENIHGTIHNTIGGVAHMWNLRYSAFDPIFWLHHCNVDRLFAIWENLNSNYSIPSWSNKAQTFTMPSGIPTDADTRKENHLIPPQLKTYIAITALKPFHKSEAGDFWTSNQVRDTTKTFAYTYPILQDLTPTDTLIRRVNEAYSPKKSRDVSHLQPVPRGTNAIAAAAVAFGSGWQYTLNVEAKQCSLNASASVMVFLKPTDPMKEETVFVGKTSFIQQNVAMGSDSEQATVHSVVPLTPALEAKWQSGELSSMDPEVVKKYLNKNLEWKTTRVSSRLARAVSARRGNMWLGAAY